MTEIRVARTATGLLPLEAESAAAGASLGGTRPVNHPDGRILATTATSVLIELDRPAILCGQMLCPMPGQTRLDESDGNASWWCLPHGADAAAGVALDECRTVRDAGVAMQAVAS